MVICTWDSPTAQGGWGALPHHQDLLRLGDDDGAGPDLQPVLQLRQLVGGYVARVDLPVLQSACSLTPAAQVTRDPALGYNNRAIMGRDFGNCCCFWWKYFISYPGIALCGPTDDKLIPIPLSFQTKSLKVIQISWNIDVMQHNNVYILCNISYL